jgi:type III pantothenate kinase
MNLIIDIGNSSVKAALMQEGRIIMKTRLDSAGPATVSSFIGRRKIDRAIVSSVGTDPSFLMAWLKTKAGKVHLLASDSVYPFDIEYGTPETLGADRLAAAAGAWHKFPGSDLLVIDAGSAMTVDHVTGGVYRGGSISPGLSMRFRALHEFTGRLPLVTARKGFSFPGSSTDDAIAGGVMMGMVYEINEYIRTFGEKHLKPVTVITGGDGEILSGLVSGEVHYYPDLVTEGLNYLLEENA